MNGDEERPTPESTTASDGEKPVAPGRTVKYKDGTRTYKRRRGAHSPPETQTVERRLELTKRKARELNKVQSTTIPLRLAVGLEMHESLVAVAEKIGGAKVPNVALRCMELGLEQWARALKLKLEHQAAPLTVFDRQPHVANAHRHYGNGDETRVREELRTEAEEIEAQRDEVARDLHLPGRRRAPTS